MLFRIRNIFIVSIVAMSFSVAIAKDNSTMKEDKSQVTGWNSFAQKLLLMHKKLIKGREVEVKRKVDGYSTHPKYFKEESYYDKKSGKLISKIQWERKNPKNIHSIEVYVRDNKGRVIRDYSVTYLPDYRNSPVQTLVNFHGYGKKMHGFRQFDASGDLIYEQCEGTYKGKKVTHRMFEDMLVNGGPHVDKIMASKAYRLCFKGVATKFKKNADPY